MRRFTGAAGPIGPHVCLIITLNRHESPGPKKFRCSITAAFKRAAKEFSMPKKLTSAQREANWEFFNGCCGSSELHCDQTFSCDAKRQVSRGQNSRHFPLLAAHVNELCNQFLLVVREIVMQEACIFTQETGMLRANFKASRAWALKFTKKAGLTMMSKQV